MSWDTDMALDAAHHAGALPSEDGGHREDTSDQRPRVRRSRTAYLDIETATQPRVLLDRVKGQRFEDPQDVILWCCENAAEEARNPIRGRVIAWAVCTSDELERGGVDEVGGPDTKGEYDLLLSLLVCLEQWEPGRIATWNGTAFDFPFLRARALALGVDRLAQLLWAEKPWDTRLVDLSGPTWFPRPSWSFGNQKDGWRWTLDAAAELLGISRPDQIAGADVPAAWYRQEFEAIAAHNLDDVRTLRAVARRLAAGRGSAK